MLAFKECQQKLGQESRQGYASIHPISERGSQFLKTKILSYDSVLLLIPYVTFFQPTPLGTP